MTTSHYFSLNSIKPQKIRKGGWRADAKISELSTLKGLSLSLLELNPNGVREPHWHPNANELGYCIEGEALITVFSPGAVHETFTIQAGDLSFVPMGSMHYIANTGNSKFRMAVCFDNEDAEDLDLSAGVSVMPDHILAYTLQETPDFFEKLHKNPQGVFITEVNDKIKPALYYTTNRFKLELQSINPQVRNKGGWVKMSNSFLFPSLDGLAAYSLLLAPKGAREPHWHPNAAELNFLIQGNARITLLSPGGKVETFDMKANDLSFMPRGYLHHIENTGDTDAVFIIFFNNSAPSDLGYSGCMGAYPNDVLAALFGVSTDYFETMPKYQHDLLIVGGG